MTEPHADSFAHTVASAIFGRKAHDAVAGQIRHIAAFSENDQDIRVGATKAPLDKMPPELLAHHAMLFFQCDAKIAKKIDDLENPFGEQMVIRMPPVTGIDGRKMQFVNLWNAQTGEYDCYEEILALRDPKTGFQGAAFYDHERKRMTFNFGGTDFTNIKNDVLTSGLQMMAKTVDNRMAKAIPFTREAMRILHDRHPEWMDETVYDIAGHSTGVNNLALAKYCLETQFGVPVRSQHLIEPAGAINAYHTTSKLIAQAMGDDPSVTFAELTRNAHTYKAEKGSFINWFPSLSQNIGDISLVDVPGDTLFSRHLGASFVKGFVDEARCITVSSFAEASAAPAARRQMNA